MLMLDEGELQRQVKAPSSSRTGLMHTSTVAQRGTFNGGSAGTLNEL